VNRGVFANDCSITDLDSGVLAGEIDVLGRAPNQAAVPDLDLLPERGGAVD